MPSSNEILSQMTLRSVKGSPLSNDEMDKNLMLLAELIQALKTAVQTVQAGGILSVTELPSDAAEDEVVFLTVEWNGYKGQNLYQYIQGKWEQVVPDVPDTVVIGDNSITTPKLAARSITADKMAVNSITAGNASIANAAVGTLSIAGNAVTLCQTMRQADQTQSTLPVYGTWMDACSMVVTLVGSQPVLVWGVWQAVGCIETSGSNFQSTYWGKKWQFNGFDTSQDARAVLINSQGNQFPFPQFNWVSAPNSNAQAATYMALLTGLSAGTYTLKFQLRASPILDKPSVISPPSSFRYASLALLETRR